MIPIPFPTTGRTYVIVFVIVLVCWPLFGLITDRKLPTSAFIEVGVLIAIMVCSYLLNYFRCSSTVMSYWGGLCFVSGAWRTGCVNISIFIILPLLFILHFWCIVISLISLALGGNMAERAFLKACWRFSRHGFDYPKVEAELEIPHDRRLF